MKVAPCHIGEEGSLSETERWLTDVLVCGLARRRGESAAAAAAFLLLRT
jgi:hypothetical protein